MNRLLQWLRDRDARKAARFLADRRIRLEREAQAELDRITRETRESYECERFRRGREAALKVTRGAC